jgi:endonuclease/exonuclease/phosphatase (EEP) superfamily protein YafD
VLRQLATVAGWLATGAIAAVVVPTWLGYTLHPAHAALQLALPYWAVPASVILLLAVVLHRAALAVAAGVLLTGLVTSTIGASTGTSLAEPKGPTLTVYVANVLVDNPSSQAKVEQALHSGADVLVIIELTPDYVERFRQAGVDEAFPHQLLDPKNHPYGSGIYSRLPIVAASLHEIGRHVEPRITIELDGHLIDIMAVHVSAPVVPASLSWWKDELRSLDDASARLERPTIWAGDFNASRWHPDFAALAAGPMIDVHHAAGLALTPSWPNEGLAGVFGPWTRIDHALVSDLDVAGVRDLPAAGSDHTPFVVTVAAR